MHYFSVTYCMFFTHSMNQYCHLEWVSLSRKWINVLHLLDIVLDTNVIDIVSNLEDNLQQKKHAHTKQLR